MRQDQGIQAQSPENQQRMLLSGESLGIPMEIDANDFGIESREAHAMAIFPRSTDEI